MFKSTQSITTLAKIAYTIGCICLYIISIWIFGAAVWRIIKEILSSDFTVYKLLDEVGLIVFSIAVIDVTKYLMIEEVVKGAERPPREARHAFTKFVIIIVTALSLEGLVLTIETAKTDLTMVIYPIFIFLTVTLLIVSLGVYQKLNASSEKERDGMS